MTFSHAIPGRSDRSAALTLAACCFATFLVPLDITVVAVALDQIGLSTHASFGLLQWILNGYTLAFTSMLLTGGSLADLVGRRRMLILSAAAFGMTSLICAVVGDPLGLVAARILQGVSGALMLTAAMGVMANRFRGAERPRAFAIWGMVVGAGFAFGPLLGGAVMAAADWRWIFLLNLPVVAVVIAVAASAVTESRADTAQSIDVVGMMLSAIALFAGVFALLRMAGADWQDRITLGGFGIAIIAIALFLRIEGRRTAPMLDLALFKNRTFSASVLVSLLSGASYYAVLVYLPLYFQAVAHLNSLSAGLALLPMTLPILFGAPIGGWLVARVNSGLFLGTGMTFVGLGLAALCFTGPDQGWLTIGILTIIGISNGIINAQLTAAVVDAAPADRASLASGLASMSRHAGFAIGTAALGLVLAGQIGSYLQMANIAADGETARQIASGLFENLAIAGGRDVAAAAFTYGLKTAIGVAAAFALAAGAIGIVMLKPRAE